MEHSVIIKSAQNDTVLEFSKHVGYYYDVCVRGPSFHAATRVYDSEPADLEGFFRDLAANRSGWFGSKEWGSAEGEVSLTASSDTTGHATLSIHLISGPYCFDWDLSTALLIQLDQLDDVATQMKAFVERGGAAQQS